PRLGEALHPGADERDHLADEEEAIVPVAEGGKCPGSPFPLHRPLSSQSPRGVHRPHASIFTLLSEHAPWYRGVGMADPLEIGLTFDDVLLVPQRSGVSTRRQINTRTRLCRGIELAIPRSEERRVGKEGVSWWWPVD